MPMAVTIRIAPRATLGSSAIRSVRKNRKTSRPRASISCATCVRPPAESTTEVRDWLAETGNPCQTAASRFAEPNATSSRFG